MVDQRIHPTLRGADKAAVVMLASGPEQASKLFSRLDLDEIKMIGQAMSNLGVVQAETVEQVLIEFNQKIGSSGSIIGNYDSVERMLSSFLGTDKVSAIMEEIRGPAGRTVWDKLGNVNESVLASYLKNEYPQTVAVVMSKIKPDHAARVLANLPEDVAIESVMRMLRMEVVQKDILNDVERTLRSEFMTNLARTNRRDNHEIMAEIFNYLDRSTESRMIEMLEERNKEAADRVRSLMFTFEDLAKVDGAGIQVLLRQIDNARLALALKGSSQKLRDLFLGNMSERAAKILREDMESLGPVRLRDVEEAQMLLVNAAKELAATGEIFLADGKEDEMLV
ncbi:MAG: flagellar motor switch protein FliG [Geminicoccaceae bacterium]|nr:flagellar motor switch protein FliG [Geminicoccaceae bacterium]